MNVVFISPHFPPQYHLFCSALRAKGAKVLGLGDAPAHELRPEVKAALDEYVTVPDMVHYDNLYRAVAYLASRHGRIDRIDSNNEFWLGLEARLREDFNVFGLKPSDTARNRSKSGMREVFVGAGVPCTAGEPVTSTAQALSFAKRHGYPVVLKPDVGVGAYRTFRIADEPELKKTLEQNLSGYVIEKFERGDIVTFDGLTDRSGRIVFFTSHVYSGGIMDVVNQALDIHYYSRRELSPRLEDLGRRAVAAFGVTERFFHLEFFERSPDEYVALEINVRPPGGFTTDMMNFACDFDVYGLWAEALTGSAFEGFRYERKYHVAHASRRHGRRYALPHQELVRKLGPMLVIEREMPSIFAGAMGDHMYMLRHPDLAALRDGISLVDRTV